MVDGPPRVPILTVGLALLLGDDLRPVDISSLVVSQLAAARQLHRHQPLEETAWTGVFQTRLEERPTIGLSPRC